MTCCIRIDSLRDSESLPREVDALHLWALPVCAPDDRHPSAADDAAAAPGRSSAPGGGGCDGDDASLEWVVMGVKVGRVRKCAHAASGGFIPVRTHNMIAATPCSVVLSCLY